MNTRRAPELVRNLTPGAVLGAALLLAGCGGVQSRVHKGAVDSVINQEPSEGRYITAIGIGASDPKLPSDTQRKALARDAAIVKAQFEMLSMIRGVTLKGGVRVERAVEADSAIESSMLETLRGAEVVKSEFTSDSGCVVTMRIPRSRLDRMLSSEFE